MKVFFLSLLLLCFSKAQKDLNENLWNEVMMAVNMTALPLTANGTYYVKEGVVHDGEYYFFKIANNDFENCLICDVGQQLDVKVSFAVVNSA